MAQSQEVLDTKLSEGISQNIDTLVHNFNLENFLHLLFATICLVIAFVVFDFLVKRLIKFYNTEIYPKLPEIKAWGMAILSQSSIHQGLRFFGDLATIFFRLSFIYFYLTYSFSIFPKTQDLGLKLWGYVQFLFTQFFGSVISFVPNLLKIGFIVLVTFYALKLSQVLVRALYFRNAQIPGMKREWIFPTYQIARFFIIVFAVIMIFPYLPGSDSPAFKGISVFIGLLVTLGSSSAISNIVAGVVLTYMTPFKQGNKVKVDNVIGTVTDMSLLVTRIRTIKNEDITIPNSQILAKEMVNFSSSVAKDPKLILYIPVSLGYDVDREQVESLLLKSCTGVEGVIDEPAPFVLIKELGDYSINYELNFHVENAHIMPTIKSDVIKNILDKFKAAEVEILSPAHIATRVAS